MAVPPDAAVVAEGLEKRFGETQALAGVDLTVERAKVVALLGPNGAGKTTAVRAITTLITPDKGRVFIDGIDVYAEPMRAKARIGLTGQYAAVDERLTAAENLEHVGRLYRMSKKIAQARGRELLDRFDLVEAADRVVKGYSGGMRRRLDIAMSLIGRPSVLFLDEPTTGLDPRSRLAVWELIEELIAGGTTTLLTTQYLDEADRLADEVVVIDHGTVIARGTSALLKQQVGADRVAVTLRDPADAERARAALAPLACGDIERGDAEHTGDPLVLSVPVTTIDGVVPEIVRRLDAAGVPFSDAQAHHSTLDDVFFALTGHAAEDITTTDEPTTGAPR
jgi:ABC-2 type transport system ATP-binding protein